MEALSARADALASEVSQIIDSFDLDGVDPSDFVPLVPDDLVVFNEEDDDAHPTIARIKAVLRDGFLDVDDSRLDGCSSYVGTIRRAQTWHQILSEPKADAGLYVAYYSEADGFVFGEFKGRASYGDEFVLKGSHSGGTDPYTLRVSAEPGTYTFWLSPFSFADLRRDAR